MSNHTKNQQTPEEAHRPPRVGLALGAGGARGWAHVGVLRRLLELGIPVDCIAGTSAGALVGAAFLAGKLDLLEDFSRHLNWKQTAKLLFDMGFPRAGLLTGHNVEHFMRSVLQLETFERLSRPFAAVATDLHSHAEEVFTSGDLVAAIRASISIPGVFTPARHYSRDLVDGSLVNPLPISILRDMGADIVIAVDVNLRHGTGEPCPVPPKARQRAIAPSQPMAEIAGRFRKHMRGLPRRPKTLDALAGRWMPRRKELSIFDVLTQSLRIIENQVTQSRLATHPPDILIQPAVGDIFTLDFPRAQQAIDAGVIATNEKLSEIEALLKTVEGGSR